MRVVTLLEAASTSRSAGWDLSNMDMERLIECVKRHTVLYDVYHKEFKNFHLKASIWELIGRELNLSDEAVKAKWKSIRTGYTKYKKQTNQPGSNKKNVGFPWSSQLSFLDNFKPPNSYVLPEATSSPSSSYIQQSRDFELSQEFIPLSSNLSPLLTQVETPTPEIVNVASLSRLTCLNEEAPFQRRKRKVDQGKIPRPDFNKKKQKVDGIDHLFLSYAETFKKFPPREQALLKLELAKMFSNTELKLLAQNSDKYPALSPPHSNSSLVDNTTLQEIIEDTKQPMEYVTEIKEEYDS